MNFAFTAENQKAFDALLTRYPTKQAALLPVLWLAQKQHGYLPFDVQEAIALMLDLPPGHVYGVVSFYTMFKDKPVGKYHLQVCRTLSCALVGSESIARRIEDKLKIKNGETTKDGLFSLELVECLASCGTGPAMQVNEAYMENLTEPKIDELLEKLAKT
jgi:NADH-quinone oxidoreductase subunit E